MSEFQAKSMELNSGLPEFNATEIDYNYQIFGNRRVRIQGWSSQCYFKEKSPRFNLLFLFHVPSFSLKTFTTHSLTVASSSLNVTFDLRAAKSVCLHGGHDGNWANNMMQMKSPLYSGRAEKEKEKERETHPAHAFLFDLY